MFNTWFVCWYILQHFYSIFVRDSSNCHVAAVCQQFRMRDCHDVSSLVACSTQPIIESSDGNRFGPFPFSYSSLARKLSILIYLLFYRCLYFKIVYSFMQSNSKLLDSAHSTATGRIFTTFPLILLPKIIHSSWTYFYVHYLFKVQTLINMYWLVIGRDWLLYLILPFRIY